MSETTIQLPAKKFCLVIEEGGYFQAYADDVVIKDVTSFYINRDAEENVLDIQLYQVGETGFMRTVEVLLSL